MEAIEPVTLERVNMIYMMLHAGLHGSGRSNIVHLLYLGALNGV